MAKWLALVIRGWKVPELTAGGTAATAKMEFINIYHIPGIIYRVYDKYYVYLMLQLHVFVCATMQEKVGYK